uniref:Uncharacterized protein n=1 Tax=Marseillevirus LCMAC103 TaxID=2506604 RepID=A0A481YVD2_9VIRU|nr:MAG: hypothetical protein LCMAC103_01950 [Marseillevirus LCMAC103]
MARCATGLALVVLLILALSVALFFALRHRGRAPNGVLDLPDAVLDLPLPDGLIPLPASAEHPLVALGGTPDERPFDPSVDSAPLDKALVQSDWQRAVPRWEGASEWICPASGHYFLSSAVRARSAADTPLANWLYTAVNVDYKTVGDPANGLLESGLRLAEPLRADEPRVVAGTAILYIDAGSLVTFDVWQTFDKTFWPEKTGVALHRIGPGVCNRTAPGTDGHCYGYEPDELPSEGDGEDAYPLYVRGVLSAGVEFAEPGALVPLTADQVNPYVDPACQCQECECRPTCACTRVWGDAGGGAWTCPATGRYFVSFFAGVENLAPSAKAAVVEVRVDGRRVVGGERLIAAGDVRTVAGHATVELAAGSTIALVCVSAPVRVFVFHSGMTVHRVHDS